MKPPAGYSEVKATDEASEAFDHFPAGYKKQKTRRDEHSRRVPKGPQHVCGCCYRKGSIHEFICRRCLRDRHDLALLEQEIAKSIPAISSMTSAEIFRRLWEQNKKLRARNAELKAKLQAAKDDMKELAGA